MKIEKIKKEFEARVITIETEQELSRMIFLLKKAYNNFLDPDHKAKEFCLKLYDELNK